MLSKEKMIDMQEVVDDCKSFSGMAFSGTLFKVKQFQKAPGLLGEALEEVISLREQLAELKALKPSFYLLKTPYYDAWGDACDLRCYADETDASKAKDDFGGVIVPIFTAAKPAEE